MAMTFFVTAKLHSSWTSSCSCPISSGIPSSLSEFEGEIDLVLGVDSSRKSTFLLVEGLRLLLLADGREGGAK